MLCALPCIWSDWGL